MATTRPVWAEISLERLTANYHSLRNSAAAASPPSGPPSALLAVVKANAYGHGVDLCGPALAAAGAPWLGVTSVEEGAALRRALGVLPSHLSATRILVMSSLWHGEADTLIDRALTPQVWEPYQFELLHQAARRRGLGAATLPVHLEIDTGMARQGVAPGAPLAALLAQHCSPGSPVTIEGVLTHFSAPEMLASQQTDQQLARFASAHNQLASDGVHPRWVHAGNSATALDRPHIVALAALAARSLSANREPAQLMLRPGLSLYGYPVRFTPPAQAAQPLLQPVLAWKTRITSLRRIPPGEGAGYNSIFRATRPSRLALVPVGYADGLNRLLSNPLPTRGSAMLVRGQRAPIAGRISMDQTVLDVTNIPHAEIGDEAVILGEQMGEQGQASITAYEHADLCGTIPYEILCSISARVPRIVCG